ncbi:MAG: hypothetical protein ABW065_03270 [Solirubrobacterales bacterium]
MVATYAAVLAIVVASLAIGQAALALCGICRWSWLSPAVGLALLVAVCWATVRIAGDGVGSAVVVAVLAIASVAYLWSLSGGGATSAGVGSGWGGREALWVGAPVTLLALLAASIPFAVEGHFGILGTSFNPDMSQHLLAASRLADGLPNQLIHQGYPLGPHSVVVALNKGLGIGLVQGFSGLTVAVAILAPLTVLTAFRELPAIPRTAGALVVGLAYVVASYFAQGAFKETMQALFLLAFVLALREASRNPDWSGLPLRFVPASLLAVGSVYTYSFPGLIWLGGAAVLWLLAELVGGRATRAANHPLGPRPVPALLLALLAFIVLVAPELGRMLDFHSFETFDPNGPGLGNLFGQVSPFEALGIWPSGDFRLAPGDGAVPALAYYLGIAFGLALLAWGAVRCWLRREWAVLAGLAAAALAYAAARVGGTPYTAAKAIEIASSVVALTILLPLLPELWFFRSAYRTKGTTTPAGRPDSPLAGAAAGVFLIAAGACSLLALANAPVGPTSYSPALTEMRPLVADGPVLALPPRQLLADEHGTPYIAWELRGGRVCITAAEEAGEKPPPGVRYVITWIDAARESGDLGAVGVSPPFAGFAPKRAAPPYVLWEATRPVAGHSPCPLIAVRQARQGPAR